MVHVVMIHVRDSSAVISLPQTDINTYVMNFGPSANDETICAVSNLGEEYWSATIDQDGIDIFLEHFTDNFCYLRMYIFSIFFNIMFYFLLFCDVKLKNTLFIIKI